MPTPQSDPLAPLFAALAQAMQQQGKLGQGRLQLQNDQAFGRHLGMDGTPITGGNPFLNGFFKSSASQLSPESLMRSQGSTAMNQWLRPDLFGSNSPDGLGQTSQQSIVPPQPTPQRRKGASFGFPGGFGSSASPRPGFRF